MSNVFVPNINKVELCLTYRCNVKCNNCCTLCTQAPAANDLSLSMLHNFITESVYYNHKWEEIILHGGEPTLHPQYVEICNMLAEYRDKHNTTVILHVCSNGTNDFVQKQLQASTLLGIKSEISVKVGTNRREWGEDIPYVPVNESPTDLGQPYSLGCYQTTVCGICYNYLGFFECSTAGATARVFGYSSLCVSIKDLTAERLAMAFPEHCKHCGFAMPERRRVIDQTNTNTWQKALDTYKK